MEIKVFADADVVAREAAALIAAEARAAIAARGRFVVAFSGGKSPWAMLRELAREDLPWQAVYVAQIDERVAPDGHPDRNMTHLQESLLDHVKLKPEQVLAMPVESSDLQAAAAEYAIELERVCGAPPVLDLAHLGLGPDGHTASLVPDDPVLGVTDRDVAISGPYQGRQRMTLTYPMLNRARRVLWLLTGGDKKSMVARLLAGDPTIPAGRVASEPALVFADKAASDGSGVGWDKTA